ncbi:MAG: nucleotidyltransferase domain-containing protein, partial [Terrimesophilobacter sp.]
MSVVTPSSLALRELIDVHRGELDAVMRRYGASNPRLFGSVARGDATEDSDID